MYCLKFAENKFTTVVFPTCLAPPEYQGFACKEDIRKVLENYSHPLLDCIEWKKTQGNNIEVTNETGDYYRYFDATVQAEFLFECVRYTIEKIIPEEVAYLQNFDEMKMWLDDRFQMPDSALINSSTLKSACLIIALNVPLSDVL